MSAKSWDYFVRKARSDTLKRFGKHVTRIVDVERNEQSGVIVHIDLGKQVQKGVKQK